MATYTTSDFKPGLKFMQDGEPCVIVENEFVKPGKGQAFTRTRIRKLISGKVLDVNFKSGTSVEAADVMDLNLTYSYKDDAFWYFMHPETFEQYSADAKAVGDAEKWLLDQSRLYRDFMERCANCCHSTKLCRIRNHREVLEAFRFTSACSKWCIYC